MKLQSILAVLVWCAVAIIWNLAVFGTLVRAIINGNFITLLIMIPFVLIGLVLLVALYSSVRVGIESLFKLGTPTPPAIAETTKPPVLTGPAATSESSNGISLKGKPILAALIFITFINWFVFFGISIHLGGDALGILPSHDGFVVKSHGNHTAVSESAWRFSLFYSTATLLGTPAIWIPFGIWQLSKNKENTKRPMKWFVGLFLLVWIIGWYSSIGSSFYRSYNDWQKFKQQSIDQSKP